MNLPHRVVEINQDRDVRSRQAKLFTSDKNVVIKGLRCVSRKLCELLASNV